MAGHVNEIFRGVTATEDLSGFKYRAVTLAGTVAAAPQLAAGILKTGCASGYNASVIESGLTKIQAGGAVSTVGWPITITTSGFAIACASGGTAIGRVHAAAASGDLVACAVDFNMPFLFGG